MSGENIHTEADFQTWLDLDRNWNPIQDAYDQCGYGPPLDDSLAEEFQDTGYTFRWKNCPAVKDIDLRDDNPNLGSFVVQMFCDKCLTTSPTSICLLCANQDTFPVLVKK